MEAKAAVQLGRLATTAATVEEKRTYGQGTECMPFLPLPNAKARFWQASKSTPHWVAVAASGDAGSVGGRNQYKRTPEDADQQRVYAREFCSTVEAM